MDFVAGVAILMVRKCQSTAFEIANFSIFWLIFLHNHCLGFLLQGLKLKHCLCWTILFKNDWFAPWTRILVVQECQDAINIDIFFFIQTQFFISTCFVFSTETTIVRSSPFWRACGWKTSIPFAQWNPNGPKNPKTFSIWTHLDSQARFSPKQFTSYVPSRSRSETFHSWSINSLKVIFFHVVEFWCTRIAKNWC